MTAQSPDLPYPSSAEVPAGAIVVGIDGREEDANALDWAAAEAVSLGAPVHVITALDIDLPLAGGGEAVPMALIEDALDDDATARLERA
ncbi:universal stress protein, partial [Nostocoides australiense]|uniref:universal stress protein n=1 Tax=Nostocoides australiense TaxID=99480 RepID=UPI00065FCA8A